MKELTIFILIFCLGFCTRDIFLEKNGIKTEKIIEPSIMIINLDGNIDTVYIYKFKK